MADLVPGGRGRGMAEVRDRARGHEDVDAHDERPQPVAPLVGGAPRTRTEGEVSNARGVATSGCIPRERRWSGSSWRATGIPSRTRISFVLVRASAAATP